jgi:hypothetical protein
MSVTLNAVVHSVDIEEGEKLVTPAGAAKPVRQPTYAVSLVLRSTDGPHVLHEASHLDPTTIGGSIAVDALGKPQLTGIKKGDAFTITLTPLAAPAPAAPVVPAPATPAAT